MTRRLFFLSFLGSIWVVWACNEPSDLGSFLEEEGKIEVSNDSIPIHATVMSDPAAPTWQVNQTLVPTHMVGRMMDPIFGTVEASLNFQIGIQDEPNFSGAILDSVILSLAYDTLWGTYGPASEQASFEVYKLAEDLYRDSTYYTNSLLASSSEPVGSTGPFQPNYIDSISVDEPLSNGNGHDSVKYIPHLRINLLGSDQAYGKELLALTVDDFASNEIFRQHIKGLVIRPTNEAGKMVHFSMFDRLTRLNLYYSQNDTAKVMRFPVLQDLVAINTYSHDFAGSPAGNAIDNPEEGDSMIYVQSMGGPSLKIEVGDLSAIGNSVVNNATLTIPLGYLAATDSASYPPIDQLIIEELTESGEQKIIEDIGSLLYNRDLGALFGGKLTLDETTGMSNYTFNITRHVQKMSRGDVSHMMVISNLFKGSSPARSILLGHGAQLGAKLNITRTDI